MNGARWVLMTFCVTMLLGSGPAWGEEAKSPPPVPKAPAVPAARAVPQAPSVLVSPPKAQALAAGQNIDRIQKQLDDVIAANRRLEEDYLRRMEKIRTISAQARIHQKILDKIRTQTPTESSAAQNAVRQEKVRLIAEQARKNQELLKTLRSSRQKS